MLLLSGLESAMRNNGDKDNAIRINWNNNSVL